MKKIDNFSKCLNVLKGADFTMASSNEIYCTGVIGQYNLTFELAWKALQAVLQAHGVIDFKSGSLREVLKIAYKVGFIEQEEVWLLMLKTRNASIHIYNENEINEIICLIRDSFIAAFDHLLEVLCQKNAACEINHE